MVDIKSIPELKGNMLASGTIFASLITQAGPKGEPGKDGTGVTILGSYDTLEELKIANPIGNIGDAYMIGTNLYVWNAISNNWIDVGCIQGPQGEHGEKGETGADGKAATITIGTVTTGEAGTSAIVTNSGTDSDAIFDFMIPKGEKGDDGHTPVKGTDYFTSADKNEIVTDYISKYKLIITETTAAGTEITLPCYYAVGQDTLDVYLNGERLLLSSDNSGTDGHYREVGTSGSVSNKIKTTTDWNLESGDVLDLEVRGEYSDT